MEEVRKQGVESLFCAYEQALELKDLGFNEECFGWYSPVMNGLLIYCNSTNDGTEEKYCTAPLWQQSFDWLWNKTGRYIIPIPNDDKEWLCMGNKFKTYEEARLECLKKLIEIVKNESK